MQDPEQFVANFIDFWNDPSPQRISEILHPDAVLTQPLAPPMRGIAAVEDEFRRIWRLLPDLHVQVDRWRGDAEVLFIELRLRAHVRGKLIEWPAIDRFVLRDGKAAQRMTYFDPLPVMLKILKRPSLWQRWWTSGAARPWRTGHHLTPSRTHLS